MPANKEDQINLLPKKGFATTTVGRILSWLLSTFRIIVIVTEMIVMLAFLSRFWLDAKNSDLNDQIEQKKAVLAASGDFEKQFKDTQRRLNTFSALTANTTPVASSLKTVTSYLPSDIFLTSYSLSAKNIQVSAIASSEKSIQQFIANLQSNEIFQNISLTEVKEDSKNSTFMIFGLDIKLK